MTSTLTYKRFWLVWSPTGHNPSYKHATESSAVTECERLARLHPGSTFAVMECKAARLVDSMMRIEMSDDAANNIEVPF